MLYSLQKVPTLRDSVEPHKTLSLRQREFKKFGWLTWNYTRRRDATGPEADTEPDFLTTSPSSSVPGTHNVQIAFVI